MLLMMTTIDVNDQHHHMMKMKSEIERDKENMILLMSNNVSL